LHSAVTVVLLVKGRNRTALAETSAKRLSTRSNLFACQSKNGAQESGASRFACRSNREALSQSEATERIMNCQLSIMNYEL